jgi:putative sterol carrier protein
VFLEQLVSRGQEPLLHGVQATMQVDLVDGTATQQKFITMDNGVVSLSKSVSHPDAIVRADRVLFEGIVEGRVNAMAALLRGALSVDGDLSVVAAFSRLLPGPPGSAEAFAERQRRSRHG